MAIRRFNADQRLPAPTHQRDGSENRDDTNLKYSLYDIFRDVRLVFEDVNSSITTINNTITNIKTTFSVPTELGGQYATATINAATQIQPSGSYLTSLGGTLTQVVETPPTTYASKLMRGLVSSSAASTPCGYRVNTNANSGIVLSASGQAYGGFSWGVLFGTHPTTETTATTSKCIGISSFTGFSVDPTSGNWTNNASFNTGSAFGMVSNEGSSTWSLFHKANAAAATVISLGVSRVANQLFGFFARNEAGKSTTLIQVVSIDPSTGAQTTVYNTSLSLNTEAGIYLQPFFCASATTAVLHGIVFQRSFMYVPDAAFLMT